MIMPGNLLSYHTEMTTRQEGYLVIDIGTGNVRVAVCEPDGNIVSMARENVIYREDEKNAAAMSFDPNSLWKQIIAMAQGLVQETPQITISAITASSQREGIVLVGKQGESLIGLPNHDHRGREWEAGIKQKNRIYELTGRYPSSLFSALKLIGIKNETPALYRRCEVMLSISDWAQYQLCGVVGYEHSQASETQLYDVERREWSDELCTLFGLDKSILPPLHISGQVQGTLLPGLAKQLGISPKAKVVVGGADTQLAIKSTQPVPGDIVLVSGTTTPVVKIVSSYKLDDRARTWTGRHVEVGEFVLEANAGVTGLNYQRLKEIFYPNEGYDVIERELEVLEDSQCVASLGSLLADEKVTLTKGGFIFNVPVSNQLTRAHFIRSALWDIACCIKGNYDSLCEVDPYPKEYVWACGGGFQSKILAHFIANLINKKVLVKEGYRQASVMGGVLICNEALGRTAQRDSTVEEIVPKESPLFEERYQEWKETRRELHRIFTQEVIE